MKIAKNSSEKLRAGGQEKKVILENKKIRFIDESYNASPANNENLYKLF